MLVSELRQKLKEDADADTIQTLMNDLRSAGYLHVALVGLEGEKPRQ